MLCVKNISFAYRGDLVLDNISFSLPEGGVLATVGESGSGKSTLLKLIYGEYDLDNGVISWKNQTVLGPKDKLIVGPDFMKYVAQEFDLMPYTTVAENIGSHLSNFYPEQKKERILELLEVVGLRDFARQKVQFLSGGQKQRVALAKALADQPEILLLDEPFSHIDSFKKRKLRQGLFQFLKANNIACVVATHDKDDVLPYADNVLVLHQGRILSEGSPKTLFETPKHPIIAAFFSDFNIINGHIYYAHQIVVCPNETNLNVTVVNSYYKGNYFLIESEHFSQKIWFEHKEPLERGADVFLTIA